MRTFRHAIPVMLFLAVAAVVVAQNPASKRRMTPVENQATKTQNINQALTDTARIKEARIARSTHFHDEQGRTIYVDTVTGEQWMDSTAMLPVVKMKYPLLFSASAGIDIWDPLMRAFGQDYGLVGAWAELSMHNRYNAVFEIGAGQAKHSPEDNNYTYRSPASLYFKLGINYNFLYNSSPDYQFYAGLRYGFSPFCYSIDDITIDAPYWDESARFNIPSQNATAGWLELVAGLRVKIWGPISAGWSFKYHKILHESKAAYGKPWYIPGYGSRGSNITGSFSISYTFSLDKLNKRRGDEVITTNETSAAGQPENEQPAAD